jgi:hypothetical protein
LLQAPSGTQLWKAAKFRKRKRDRGKIQIRENGSGELEPRYAHKHARYDIAEAQGLGFFLGGRSTTPPACTAFTKKLKKPGLVGYKGCSCNGSSLEMHIGSPSRPAPSNVVERKAYPAAPPVQTAGPLGCCRFMSRAPRGTHSAARPSYVVMIYGAITGRTIASFKGCCRHTLVPGRNADGRRDGMRDEG